MRLIEQPFSAWLKMSMAIFGKGVVMTRRFNAVSYVDADQSRTSCLGFLRIPEEGAFCFCYVDANQQNQIVKERYLPSAYDVKGSQPPTIETLPEGKMKEYIDKLMIMLVSVYGYSKGGEVVVDLDAKTIEPVLKEDEASAPDVSADVSSVSEAEVAIWKFDITPYLNERDCSTDSEVNEVFRTTLDSVFSVSYDLNVKLSLYSLKPAFQADYNGYIYDDTRYKVSIAPGDMSLNTLDSKQMVGAGSIPGSAGVLPLLFLVALNLKLKEALSTQWNFLEFCNEKGEHFSYKNFDSLTPFIEQFDEDVEAVRELAVLVDLATARSKWFTDEPSSEEGLYF